MNHWFDGYAVIYKFDMHKGKVSHSFMRNVQVLVKAMVLILAGLGRNVLCVCVSSRIVGPDIMTVLCVHARARNVPNSLCFEKGVPSRTHPIAHNCS